MFRLYICSELQTGHRTAIKCKAIPILSWTDPDGPRSLRLPDFKSIDTGRWKGCQPDALAALLARNIPDTHF